MTDTRRPHGPDGDSGPDIEHGIARTPAVPGMGALIGIGAGLGMTLGVILGELVLGLIAGAALGTVVGAIVEANRR